MGGHLLALNHGLLNVLYTKATVAGEKCRECNFASQITLDVLFSKARFLSEKKMTASRKVTLLPGKNKSKKKLPNVRMALECLCACVSVAIYSCVCMNTRGVCVCVHNGVCIVVALFIVTSLSVLRVGNIFCDIVLHNRGHFP